MPVLTAVATDEEGPVAAPVVIVGAGTAGIAFAIEFCRHSRAPLVMIEQGGEAVGSSSPRFLDAVRAENLWPGLMVQCVDNGPVVPYLQARVIGGGSAINGMLEATDTAQVHSPVLAGFLGHPEPDPTVGSALAALNGRRWRRNVVDARRVDGTSALAEMVESGRLELVRGAVESVVIRDGRAVGVVVDGRLTEASCVVMCAGAVGTPLVLGRSGLPEEVRSLLGTHLLDHPAVTFTVHRRAPAPVDAPDVEFYVDTEDLPWRATAGRGEADATLAGRRLAPGQEDPLRGVGAWLMRSRKTVITGYERASADEPGLGLLSGILLAPLSTGSMDMERGPLLRPRMLSHPLDVMSMVSLVRDMIRVSLRPEIAAVATHVTVDSAGTRVTEIDGLPDELLTEWVRSHVSPLSHAAGTCSAILGSPSRPGPARAGGVPALDPTVSQAEHTLAQRRIQQRWREINRAASVRNGRYSEPEGFRASSDDFAVRGVSGLYVADSSGIGALPVDMLNAHVARRAAEAAVAVALGAGQAGGRGRTA